VIRELIVVEGVHDISAVRQAVDAECVATVGHALPPHVAELIRLAAPRCGVVVLTDPDHAGEQIRRRVEALVGGRGPCKHAYVPRELCTRGADVGIENASPAAIREALAAAHAVVEERIDRFEVADLLRHGLQGCAGAVDRRRRLGAALGVGFGNSRQLLRRLNRLGIERSAFESAAAAL